MKLNSIARGLLILAAALFAFGALIAGCGGGGIGGGGTVGVFIGDDFGGDYNQVWMTLYRVEASADGTDYQTVFDSTSGTPMNLCTLSNTAQFMGAMSMASGQYTKARVTIGDQFHLVTKVGNVPSDVPVDPTGGTAFGGKFTFTMNMPLSVGMGQMANMAIDFDLAGFQMMGGKVRMSVLPMDSGRFGMMQRRGDLEGTVANLVPGVSFDLTMGGGMMMGPMRGVRVLLDASTEIFGENGAGATLANGQRVEVQGAMDPAAMTLTANIVRIETAQGGQYDHAGAQGSVDAIDAGALRFTMTPAWTEHFQPGGTSLTVQTDANTVFRTGGMGGGMMGGNAAFADLAQGAFVMVSGVYDPGTGVLTARRVMIGR
ncbi:MAG: DUF4382 domain-containing protein [Armatimonadetes bacterium]|nr:DUF4382 domain-containing protein [Armatimonadota bacterium]